MHTLIKPGFSIVAICFCTFALTACGDDSGSTDAGGESGGDGDGDGDADAGADAAMPDELGGGDCSEGSCDYACSEGCAVQCLGAECTATCDEGNCSLDGDLGATTSYECEGGGCTVDCDGASDCTVDCGGGGCEVGCDGDSRCKVSCDPDAERCVVFCEAGSIATCDNDNCEITGCEVCDPSDVDDTYNPSIDPADYSPVIDNPYLPLKVGAHWVYENDEERITIDVLDETYVTETGVECAVVRDVVTDLDGVLIEETFDWFAQDREGNVWYFGEDTAELVNGMKANTRGSWEAGVDGALPGIVAHAETPEVGTEYKQEYYRCEAEDLGGIVATGESVSVPAGDFEDCIRIHDFSAIEPNANEHKLFCPGVGVAVVYELEPGATSGGEVVETLVEYDIPE